MRTRAGEHPSIYLVVQHEAPYSLEKKNVLGLCGVNVNLVSNRGFLLIGLLPGSFLLRAQSTPSSEDWNAYIDLCSSGIAGDCLIQQPCTTYEV
jgi:hypothetical protein